MRTKQPIQVRVGAMRDIDPTRTIVLRRKFTQAMINRFNAVASIIKESVADNDCLGLTERTTTITVSARKSNFVAKGSVAPPDAFKYLPADQKITQFMAWLRNLVTLNVLEVTSVPSTVFAGLEPWINIYLNIAWEKGSEQAKADMSTNVPFGFSSTRSSRKRVEQLRVYNALRGVADAMLSQIASVLAQGIQENVSPKKMSALMVDRVKKIGSTRAKLIARTEIVRSFNMAAIDAYEAVGTMTGRTIEVQWWTCLDERVRATHRLRHAVVYTIEEVLPLLGEPNCRCSILPYTTEGGRSR